MKKYIYLSALAIILFGFSCQTPPSQTVDAVVEVVGNPAIEGFDLENSDEKAIELADQVMEAMGGRANWDKTRYTSWVFFGSRKHTWDRYTGDVKIEYLRDTVHNKQVIFNINSMEGQVQLDGQAFTDADSVAKLLQTAKGQWINDSYWVFMPFKMKDSGVTLKYAGTDSTLAGEICEVVSMTFEEVGNTPQNKYLVYIHPDNHHIVQWDYYPDATDEAPRFASSWEGYEKYGNILLSGDRLFGGENMRQLTELTVMDSLPEGFFEGF